MSYTVQFTPEAEEQLDALEAYIAAAASPVMAARYVDGFVEFCERLETFPERGAKRDDLFPGLRITNYRQRIAVAFLVDVSAKTVSILGVFYGGQDYEARWFDEANED